MHQSHGDNASSDQSIGNMPEVVVNRCRDAGAILRDLPSQPKSSHPDIDKQDKHGFTPLMIAASLDHSKSNRGLVIVDMLVRGGANVSRGDHDGFTAVHWAAALDAIKVLRYLLKVAGADANAASKDGETPLHRASRLGRTAAVATLLDEFRCNYRQRNRNFQMAWDVAGMFTTRVARVACTDVRRQFQKYCPYFRTLVLHHDDCLEKETQLLRGGSQGSQPWESPDRITAVMGALRSRDIFETALELNFSSKFPQAGIRQLQRVHSAQYIRFVHDLARMVSMQNLPAVPFTPKVQRTLRGTDPHEVKGADVSDTSFSKGSLSAALRAAGSVCHAIDQVVGGKHRNSFCCIRPPGHHAGVNGLLQDAESCGFCIFNNVAIGALHALTEHKDVVKKVCILDFDVHHGNGTEEIVRNFCDPSKILFISVHLYLKDAEFEFYPGSGEQDVLVSNIINVPLEPVWRSR
jgi:acetoin utilization deacetylase AcuC-like enzyme